MSTLRDAHVSHNSIPGPQGVQSSGETAPVMGRSLITTRASPLIVAPPRTTVKAWYRGGQSYQKNGRARTTPSPYSAICVLSE